jgi:DeoR family transcriptional regulator, fructose operon transcriptional repressor
MYTPPMTAAERLLRLEQLFSTDEFLSLADLCKRLGASPSSLRRDLMELERKGVLRRVHGGAISLNSRDDSLDFRKLSSSHHEEKIRIGRLTAGLVENGQTVILGGGSTTVQVARALLDRPIQIITNSLVVAQVFWDCKQAEVTLTGGYMYPRLGIQLGPICERMLHGVTADVLVMGVRGISESGLSDSNSLVVGSLQKMIEAAQKVIIVADHSKFGRDSMLHVADLAELDTVVSDTELPIEFRQMLQANDVQCILA